MDITKNYSIAIMLSGHPKHLNINSKLYSKYNELYENVTFDFYVSIWDTIDNEYESFDPVIDLSKEKWVTKYETLKEEDCPFDLKNYEPGCHQPHYCWTFKKVNELRNTSIKEYDAVLQTRCDYVLKRSFLDSIVTKLKGNLFNDIIVYAEYCVKAHKEDAWVNDYFFVSSPKPMDALAEMFDDICGKNVNYDINNYNGPILMHTLQPFHLLNKGIHLSGIGVGGGLIRESYRFGTPHTLKDSAISLGNNTIKQQADTNLGYNRIHPSDNQVLRLIEDKGVLWMLDSANTDEIKAYYKNSKK